MTLLSNLRDIQENRYGGKGFDSAEVIDILDDDRLVNIYDSIGALPVTSLEAGTEAYVSSTNRYYITNGTGWYQLTMTLNERDSDDPAGEDEWTMWAMKTGTLAAGSWNIENDPSYGYVQFACDRYPGALTDPYTQDHTLWLLSAIQSASAAGSWRSIEFERDSSVVATLDFGSTGTPSGGVGNTERGSTGSWSAVYNSRNTVVDIGNETVQHTGSWSFVYDRVRMYSSTPGNTLVYTERVDTS